MLAEQFIKTIRAFEADHGLKPSDIQISLTGEITVTIPIRKTIRVGQVV